MKMYHISCLVAGAVLFALPAWAQDDATADDAMEPAPSLLQIQPDDHVLGDRDAPVTIFEFASLTCPHCAAFDVETLPELKAQMIDTGKANLVMRHFPLDQLALQAAVVADCVPDAQYYPFLNVLFSTQQDWARSDDPMQAVLQTAMLAGAPQAELTACMADDAIKNSVLSVRLRAQSELDVSSTPTFYINGTVIHGAQPYETFAEAIEAAMPAEPAPDEAAAPDSDEAAVVDEPDADSDETVTE